MASPAGGGKSGGSSSVKQKEAFKRGKKAPF